MKFSFFLTIFLSIAQCFFPFSATALEKTTESGNFLDKVEHDTFKYFLHTMNSETGLVKDNSKPRSPCNVAGIGFFLSALCIGQERGWIAPDEARKTTHQILSFIYDQMEHKNGFLYHFVSTKTGQRVWNSEISSIDTALFLAGALSAGEYFGGEIQTLAHKLFDRVDWEWMMNKSDFLCMGWTPEQKFLRSYWDRYSELMILYALAIGSETHPIPERSWNRWRRDRKTYKDYTIVYCGTGSLFTYQYSHGWMDFRYINDPKTDWWKNSLDATQANREFCINTTGEYKSFGENSWGITACLGPRGYKPYGAEPGYYPEYDGTVAPCAAAGSIVFTPSESIQALKHMYDTYGSKLYGKYGFKDAYNLDENWFADQSITINQGIMLVMIENYRSGLIWKLFMKNRYVRNWLKRCNLSKDTYNFQPFPQITIHETILNEQPLEMHRDSELTRQREFRQQRSQ